MRQQTNNINRFPIPASPSEAERYVGLLADSMENLLSLVESETKLMRVGKVAEASRLNHEKIALINQYYEYMGVIQNNAAILKQLAPKAVERLMQRHEYFRTQLQTNLVILATAKEVSEEIIKNVAETVSRSQSPSVYTSKATASLTPRNATQPIAVNRKL